MRCAAEEEKSVRNESGGVDGAGDGTYLLWIEEREVASDAVDEGF